MCIIMLKWIIKQPRKSFIMTHYTSTGKTSRVIPASGGFHNFETALHDPFEVAFCLECHVYIVSEIL